MEAWRKELYLAHASGREWKEHKYLYKEGNRYIYPEDVAATNSVKRNSVINPYNVPNGDIVPGESPRQVKRYNEYSKRIDVLKKNKNKYDDEKTKNFIQRNVDRIRNEQYDDYRNYKYEQDDLRKKYNKKTAAALKRNEESREYSKGEAKGKAVRGAADAAKASFLTSRPGSRAMDEYLRKNGITYGDLKSSNKAETKILDKIIDNVAKDPNRKSAMKGDSRYKDSRKNAMSGDSRYRDQRGAMKNDPRYKDTRKNAMSGDSRYQDQRGTGSDPRYKDMRKNAMTGDSRYQDQRGTGSDPRYQDTRKNAMSGDSRYKKNRTKPTTWEMTGWEESNDILNKTRYGIKDGTEKASRQVKKLRRREATRRAINKRRSQRV